MTTSYVLIMIFASALCTYSLRAISFIVFRGDRKMPKTLDDLGKILPAAIMSVLVVYCLKDIPDDWVGVGVPKAISVLVVALTYKWKHSTFISIVVGTACYMVLLQLFM